MINLAINIERNLLCSVLEHNFIGNDKRIMEVELDSSVFSDKYHKLIVNGINRLKELKEPVDSDVLKIKFEGAKKWDFQLEYVILEILTANPIGTYDLFMSYYKILETQSQETSKIRHLRDI